MSNDNNTATPFLDSLKASWADAESVRASGVLEQTNAPAPTGEAKRTQNREALEADGFTCYTVWWAEGRSNEFDAKATGSGRGEKIPARS